MNNAKFIIQVCKGLIRSHRARRTLMFYNVLVLLILIFLGSTVFWSWRVDHRLLFVVYWFACMWLTLLAILLAIYDMARVRLDARRARRQLEEEILREQKNDTTDDSNTP